MPNKPLRLIFWTAIFVMVVGFACSLGASGEATPLPTPTDAPVQQENPTEPVQPTDLPLPTNTAFPTPTEAPPPTDAPEPTEAPTLEPTIAPTEESPETTAYYREEFEGDISNYSYFLVRGDDDGDAMLYPSNGSLVFDLKKQYTWVYVTYDPWVYSDVRIGMRSENRGGNTQNVSLFCRYSSDGWFEVNITNGGQYFVYARDNNNDLYFPIFENGGSTLVKTGKNTNEYVIECVGNTISLYINGTFVRDFSIPQDYRFMTEGKVGLSVSSFEVIPILVNVDWFDIEMP